MSCTSESLIESGSWHGYIFWQQSNDEREGIPFQFEIDPALEKFTLINGQERISEGISIQKSKDSLWVNFEIFNNQFQLKIENKQHLQGVLYAHNTGEQVAFVSAYPGALLFPATSDYTIEGKWNFYFEEEEIASALGQFQIENAEKLKGNITTASTDYRFLTGYFYQDQFKLFTYNGGFGAVFNANLLETGVLLGERISTGGAVKKFKAIRDDEAYMPSFSKEMGFENPELPYIFNFQTIEADLITNAQNQDKIYLLQLGATWCPNCYDETHYLKELYQKYHPNGLEIIGLFFEKIKDEDKAKVQIKKVVDHLQIPYPVVFAGQADSALVQRVLPRLQNFQAYPTVLLLNKNNQVIKIKAGFAGKATGDLHQEYKEDLEKAIESVF